jgi:imidazolonepropionase-like amidohydrolase
LLPDCVVNSLADVRPVVRRIVRAGAEVIKCATTGGASSRPGHGPLDGAFNLDEMQALTDEAHALDRRVMCHALGGRGLRIAIEAGVDSIEHGCYLDEEPELLDMMAQRGIFFVPTFAVYEYHRKSALPHVRERAQHLQEHHVTSLRRAFAAGVKIAAGTDAGGHGHPSNAMEIECLVKAGLTPLQALRAATGWAAECLGLEHDIGTVEKGKLADLVVVAGDPLSDVGLLQGPERIALVLKGGGDRRQPAGENPALAPTCVEPHLVRRSSPPRTRGPRATARARSALDARFAGMTKRPGHIPELLPLVFVVQAHPGHFVGVAGAGFVTSFGYQVEPLIGAVQHVEPACVA